MSLGHEYLGLQLLQLLLQLSQLRVGLFHDDVDVGHTFLVGGHSPQILRALHDLELFLDLLAQVVAELLQLLGQRRVRQMRLDAILDAQLVQQRQAEVVILQVDGGCRELCSLYQNGKLILTGMM